MTGHLWFRARAFGWGWTPVSVEGWIVLLVFLVLMGAGVGVFVHEVQAGADTITANALFLGWIGLLVGVLLLICRLTGERPRWRWGR